ncbi:hypothetical protein [Burkholderia paludis]|uniref:hypothetical protein n=1 Tax=Burkholderia paludis TaxID=1506587 RepID=UPI0009DDA342|nr:hypothetical protein [Burkholderia paludis]
MSAAFLRAFVNRCSLQGPPIDSSACIRAAQNEIDHPFHRLPNPDPVMYVFPHLAGHATVLPLYQRVQYALPGERLGSRSLIP